MIEALIVDILLNDVDVTTIVGDKIYPANFIPQNQDRPFLVYQRIATERRAYVSNSGPTTVPHCLLEISAWTKTYKQGRELATAVRQALDGLTGEGIDMIYMENETDVSDFIQSKENKYFRIIMDFTIHFRE